MAEQPNMIGAVVAANGATTSITFDATISSVDEIYAATTLNSLLTLAYSSGVGTATITFTNSRTVYCDEVLSFSSKYGKSGELPPRLVANGSTQKLVPSSITIYPDGRLMRIVWPVARDLHEHVAIISSVGTLGAIRATPTLGRQSVNHFYRIDGRPAYQSSDETLTLTTIDEKLGYVGIGRSLTNNSDIEAPVVEDPGGGGSGPEFQNSQVIPLSDLETSAPSEWADNYQPVQIALTHQTGMASDFSDLRFVDSDDATKLNFWVEDYVADTSATVWVSVPIDESATRNIYCYYNPSESVDNESDGVATFDFFQQLGGSSYPTDYFGKGFGTTWYEINAPRGFYDAATGKTVIAFEGDSNDGYVTQYDHATGTWDTPVKVYTSTLVDDSHGNPAIVKLASGKYMVVGGAHNAVDFEVMVSDSAGDISAWTAVASFGQGTYPNISVDSGGDVHVIYRKGNGHTAAWVHTVSENEGTSWTEQGTILKTSDAAGDSWYATTRQDGDDIHLAFCWHQHTEPDEGSARYNVYHIFYDASVGDWRNMNGDDIPISLGSTSANGNTHTRAVNSGTNKTDTPDVIVFGGETHLCWAEVDASTGDVYTKHSYYTAGAWTTPTTVDTATNGQASNKPCFYVDGDGDLHIIANPYDDIAANDGVVQASTRGSIEDYVWGGGSSWTHEARIMDGESEGLFFRRPVAILNAHADFRIAFFEVISADTPSRMWAWGDSGVLGNTDDQPGGKLFVSTDAYSAESDSFDITDTNYVFGRQDFGENHAVRTIASADEQDVFLCGWFSRGNKTANDYIPYDGYAIGNLDSVDDGVFDFLTAYTFEDESTVSADTQTGLSDIRNEHVYEIKRLSGSAVFSQDDSVFHTESTDPIGSDSPLRPAFACFDTSVTPTLSERVILVRKCRPTDPTATPGATSSASKTGIE